MSLFANPSYSSPGGQLWAAKSQSGIVSGSAFVATGTEVPFTAGTYTARTVPGYNAVRIEDMSGVARWGIGLENAEAGANSGSDLVFFAYNDAGGTPTATMVIDRASGAITASNGMTVNGDLSVSQDISGATVHSGGEPVLVQQLDFVSDQFVAVPSAPAAGQTIIPIGATFTVPRTGMYILSGLLSYNGSGGTTFVASSEDFFSILCIPTPPSPGALQGGITVPLTNNGELDRVWEGVATVKLTGGIPYQANFFLENVSATVAATGGATLVGSYDLVALC